MKALAVDIGGSHATCGVVEGRKLLATETFDTDSAQNLSLVLPAIAEAFRHLSNRTNIPLREFSGVAAGFPGLADARRGRVLSTNAKYEDAPSLDLPGWSQETLGLALRLENDARLALLGESYAGAAAGFENVVMITLGTGIGGTTMIEGKLLRGKHAQAGCLGGHFPVLFNGRICTCGSRGCAESEAAGWSLPLVVRNWPGIRESTLAGQRDIHFKDLFAEADHGDRIAGEILERCLHVWAAAAVGLIHAYDPEVVIMGGGVMQRADMILPYIQAYVNKHAWTPWGKVQIRAAALGNHAALLGAVPLLSEKF